MAISLLDNFSLGAKKPNFARDLFDTVADMATFSENYLPDVFECNVKSNGNRYRYNVNNTVDAVTGKWRLVSGEGGNLPEIINNKYLHTNETTGDLEWIDVDFSTKLIDASLTEEQVLSFIVQNSGKEVSGFFFNNDINAYCSFSGLYMSKTVSGTDVHYGYCNIRGIHETEYLVDYRIDWEDSADWYKVEIVTSNDLIDYQRKLPNVVNNRYLHTNATTGELEWSSVGDSVEIDDTTTSTDKVWSSDKVDTELSDKASLTNDNEFLGQLKFPTEQIDDYTILDSSYIGVEGNGGNNSAHLYPGYLYTVEKSPYGDSEFWGNTNYHAWGIEHIDRGRGINCNLKFPSTNGTLATEKWVEEAFGVDFIKCVEVNPVADVFTDPKVIFNTNSEKFYSLKLETRSFKKYTNVNEETIFVFDLVDGADVYSARVDGRIRPTRTKLVQEDDYFIYHYTDSGMTIEELFYAEDYVENVNAFYGYWEEIEIGGGEGYTKEETDDLLDAKQNKVIETTVADFDDAVADAEDGDLISVADADGGYDIGIAKTVNQNWSDNGYNLIPFPYYDGSSKEVSGITFTVSNDGSISVSGTATSDVTFTLQFRTGGKIPYGEGTKVRLSGCPLNGSNTTYGLGINGTAVDSSFVAIGEDYGEGYITTIPDGVVQLGAYIRIYNGTTVSNLVFKPMLVEVNDDGSYPTEYQRYAMGNMELTDKLGDVETLLADL